MTDTRCKRLSWLFWDAYIIAHPGTYIITLVLLCRAEGKYLLTCKVNLDTAFWPWWSFDPVKARNSTGTGFESRSGRIFIIELVHIQCSKLFKNLNCAVCSDLYGTMISLCIHRTLEVIKGHIFNFGLPSVAILSWLCRKRRKTIFTRSVNPSEPEYIFRKSAFRREWYK